jgi:hypothetical protein
MPPVGKDSERIRPLLCAQTLASRRNALICAHCCRPAGGAQAHLRLLQQRILRSDMANKSAPQLPQLPSPDGLSGPPAQPCRCSDDEISAAGCDVVYCSDSCRALAAPAHRLLCRGTTAEELAPLKDFHAHARSCCENLLHASRVLADAIVEVLGATNGPRAMSEAVASRLTLLCGGEEESSSQCVTVSRPTYTAWATRMT